MSVCYWVSRAVDVPRMWASSSLVPNRHQWSQILGCGVSLSDAPGSEPSPHTPITRTGLRPVQFSASSLSDIPKFREERERGCCFFFPLKGRSEGLILDLSHVVYFLSPAPLSPPQRLPLGIPIKIAVMEKQEARGGRWEEVKDRSLPLPIMPPRSLFLSPQPRYDTKRPLRRRESAPPFSSWLLF